MMEKVIRHFKYIVLLTITMFSSSCFAQLQSEQNPVEREKTIVETLAENNHIPVANRIDLYHKLKKEGLSIHNLEADLNLYGYQLLWSEKTEEALEIFKLVVAEYPESSNAYDSLGEAYLKLGKKEKALINYQKSFSMDPNNYGAEDQIEKIKYPDKKLLGPKDKFGLTFSKAQYLADLDELGKTLSEVHPNVYKFIPKEIFWVSVEEKKGHITDQTTYAEFVWHCNEIIANINCAHTSGGGSRRTFNMLPLELKFPVQTRLIDGRLFIIDPQNNDDVVKLKDEITSINGIPVKLILENVFKRIASQGFIQTTKVDRFNTFGAALIPYALGFPETYEIGLADREARVPLKKAEYETGPIRNESVFRCDNGLCFEFVDQDNKIATMTISSFNYYRSGKYQEFVAFVDKCMQEMHEKGTEDLIIDVRFNGGGSPESSIHLLKYLIDEPFQYYSRAEYAGKRGKHEGELTILPFENGFKGKLYFIIDGIGNSTTGHFMSIVKYRNLGVIVGEELGSNQFCSAGRTTSRLSNTKLEYYVADNTHVTTATSLPDEVGILPDHYVTQSIDEYLDNVDAVKRFTMNLIDEKLDWDGKKKEHATYFLEANSSWRKEFYTIPLEFAPTMALKGIEDIRFPIGWDEADSTTYWSYVCAWDVENDRKVNAIELRSELQIYFDGLMGIQNKNEKDGISSSRVVIKEVKSTDEHTSYKGQVNTFDAFFSKKSLTLNIMAEQYFCKEIGRSVIRFRFSPLAYGSQVWEVLDEVKVPAAICN